MAHQWQERWTQLQLQWAHSLKSRKVKLWLDCHGEKSDYGVGGSQNELITDGQSIKMFNSEIHKTRKRGGGRERE